MVSPRQEKLHVCWTDKTHGGVINTIEDNKKVGKITVGRKNDDNDITIVERGGNKEVV